MSQHSAYNPTVRNAHDLPDDVGHLKRLVQTLQLEIERLKIQLSQLRRWKFGRSSEQLELQIEQIQLSLDVLQTVGEPAPSPTSPGARQATCRFTSCGGAFSLLVYDGLNDRVALWVERDGGDRRPVARMA